MVGTPAFMRYGFARYGRSKIEEPVTEAKSETKAKTA
jgi:hypothetical protein